MKTVSHESLSLTHTSCCQYLKSHCGIITGMPHLSSCMERLEKSSGLMSSHSQCSSPVSQNNHPRLHISKKVGKFTPHSDLFPDRFWRWGLRFCFVQSRIQYKSPFLERMLSFRTELNISHIKSHLPVKPPDAVGIISLSEMSGLKWWLSSDNWFHLEPWVRSV